MLHIALLSIRLANFNLGLPPSSLSAPPSGLVRAERGQCVTEVLRVVVSLSEITNHLCSGSSRETFQ